jgi:spore coat polysaccharide biosynthesis protein SpsF
MRKSIIIEARMTSSRLPGKHNYKVFNKAIIEYLFLRLKKVNNINDIILATTINEPDNILVEIAKKHKIKVFRGSEENVMQRVLRSAEKFKTDIIISITADCPLIDPKIIEHCINTFENNDCDYLNNLFIPTYPGGMNCQVYYAKTLKKSYSSTKSKKHQEHVTLEIIENKKKYKHLYLLAPANLHRPNLRIELDTIQDYRFIKKIIHNFGEKNYYFSCENIIKFLEK